MSEFLQIEILGNSIATYLIALGTMGIGITIILLVRTYVVYRLKRWARRTTTDLDDRLIRILEKPVTFLLYLGTFHLGLRDLELRPVIEQSIDIIILIAATVLAIRLLGALMEYGVRLYLVSKEADASLQKSVGALVPAIKVVIWAIGIVFLLDNLGFDISAVVASLGIGGVAIALASQGVLQDLFSYFSILFDQPFEIGDFIIVGDLMGTVETVGIKTTRVRSLGGEEIVFANTDITGSRIRNFKRMEGRRIITKFGLVYQTPVELLKQIPQMIQEIVERTENAVFERAHFAGYAESSLNFEMAYYVLSNDYKIYMDVQQEINLALKATFEQHQIEFAYPTRQLYVRTDAAQPNGHEMNHPYAFLEESGA